MMNTTNQLASKRKKKFTGGNASKRHRDRVNIEFNNLAKLLPFPESVIAKLDKSSILRLAVSYIRAKSFFKDTLPDEEESQTNGKSKLSQNADIYKGILEETCLTEFFLQALDGFLIVITEDLKVLYVSESVREYLGYCQAGIIHESFLQFIHWGDQENITNALRFNEDSNKEKSANGLKENGQKSMINSFADGKGKGNCNSNGFEENSDGRVQSRRFVCRMKCAFSCSSRFYTAFQTFQFSGHVRRSTIQEGKEQRTLNTLIAFGCRSGNTKFDPSEFGDVSDAFEDQRATCTDDLDPESASMKVVGLHIEPRLRPHIAPIPIAQNDADSRATSTQQQYTYNRRYGIGMRPEASFNGNPSKPNLRIDPAYHRLVNDYYREGRYARYANSWTGRSSSLSNSPISDVSSPRGIKRSASADASPESFEMISSSKQARLEANMFCKTQRGYSNLPLDDIHSSARILMQLKETQKRLNENRNSNDDSESEGSSDERSRHRPEVPLSDNVLERNHSGLEWNRRSKGIAHGINGMMQERSLTSGFPGRHPCANVYPHLFNGVHPSENGINRSLVSSREDAEDLVRRQHDEEHVQKMKEIYKTNGHHLRAGISQLTISSQISPQISPKYPKVSPTTTTWHDRSPSAVSPPRSFPEKMEVPNISVSRISPINRLDTSPSRHPPSKKDASRGFHISTILGLDDEKQKAKPEVAGQLEVDLANTESSKIKEIILRNGAHNIALQKELKRKDMKKVLNGEASDMNDIKTSFAHLLQGLTATFTQSIDKTIDTFFKPPQGSNSSKSNQVCKT